MTSWTLTRAKQIEKLDHIVSFIEIEIEIEDLKAVKTSNALSLSESESRQVADSRQQTAAWRPISRMTSSKVRSPALSCPVSGCLSAHSSDDL
jgi:hypothetical protein